MKKFMGCVEFLKEPLPEMAGMAFHAIEGKLAACRPLFTVQLAFRTMPEYKL